MRFHKDGNKTIGFTYPRGEMKSISETRFFELRKSFGVPQCSPFLSGKIEVYQRDGYKLIRILGINTNVHLTDTR